MGKADGFDITGDVVETDVGDGRVDLTLNLAAKLDGQPFTSSSTTWHSLPDEIADWIVEQVEDIFGGELPAALTGASYGQLVAAEKRYVNFLAQLTKLGEDSDGKSDDELKAARKEFTKGSKKRKKK